MRVFFIVLVVCFIIVLVNYNSQSKTVKSLIQQRNIVGNKLNQLSKLTGYETTLVEETTTEESSAIPAT